MRVKIFGLLLLFAILPALVFYVPNVLAQTEETVGEAVTEDKKVESEEEAEDKKVEKVDYELAYPGILPGHPLYFLKLVRDKVIGFLINDNGKKAEFNLLNSDKRVYAGVLLVEKGDHELAFETISKSNNYLHESVFEISKAKTDGKDVDNFIKLLDLSTRKHIEVVNEITDKIDKKFRKDIDGELGRLDEIKESVENLMSDN